MAGSTLEPWSNPDNLPLMPDPSKPITNRWPELQASKPGFKIKSPEVMRSEWEASTGLKWNIGQPEGFVPFWNENTQKWQWKKWNPENNSYDTWDEVSKTIVPGPTQLIVPPTVTYETWDKTTGKSTPKIPEATSPTATATPSAYVPLPNYQTTPIVSPFSQNFASTASTLPQYQPLQPYNFPAPKVFWDF